MMLSSALCWFNSFGQSLTKQSAFLKRCQCANLKAASLCAVYTSMSFFHTVSLAEEVETLGEATSPKSFNTTKIKAASFCGNSEQAQALAKLIAEDWQQNRKHLRCNKTLSEVAQAKAKKMSEYGMVMHNLGGSPNSELENANYQLPPYYGRNFDSNQVEAIAGGYATAEDVFEGFKKSAGHRSHLLAEVDFYLEQDEIGVGFYKNWESPHVEYWAVYIAKGAVANQNNFDGTGEIPNKSTYILLKSDEKPFEFKLEKP